MNSRIEERSTARPSAVREYGVGPAPFSCSSQLSPPRVDDFAERDRAAVAELPCPVAELMAAVARRVRLHAGQHAIAGQDLDGLAVGVGGPCNAEHVADCIRPSEQPRRRHRRRIDARVACIAHGARIVRRHRIAGQLLHERVLEFLLDQVDWRGDGG